MSAADAGCSLQEAHRNVARLCRTVLGLDRIGGQEWQRHQQEQRVQPPKRRDEGIGDRHRTVAHGVQLVTRPKAKRAAEIGGSVMNSVYLIWAHAGFR